MKPVLSLLAVSLLLAASPAAEPQDKPTVKTFTISGKVSQDGKLLMGKSGESWSVTNPASLAGHEGQLVKVKCRLAHVSHNIQVVSLKMLNSPTKNTANLSDSAFRR